MEDSESNKVDGCQNQTLSTITKENETLASLSMLRRYSKDQKFKNQLAKEADSNLLDELLFSRKEKTSNALSKVRRPFRGLCCQNCCFTSRTSLVKSTTENLALSNFLNTHISASNCGYFNKLFININQAYTIRKFKFKQVEQLVLKDERVIKAIEMAALHQFQNNDDNHSQIKLELVKKYKKKAGQVLMEMRSNISNIFLKITSWILFKVLHSFLTAVVIHPGQLNMIRECSSSNIPLIFLPLHRSNFDYILLSFILLNNGIQPPLVGVGDNLMIPFFEKLFRKLGVFFVRHRVNPIPSYQDHVYKSVLHTYMNLSLRAGHNIAYCLEGKRSRSGKACMPKYGLMSIIVECFMDGTIEDALIVPVSINYDKLLDGNFIKEQFGGPKEMESFISSLKRIWQILNSNFGMVRVNFNQPFSLRELIKSLRQKQNLTMSGCMDKTSYSSVNSLFGIDIISEDNQELVKNISKHVMYDCIQSTPIMCTNALAFLLLSKYRRGVSLEKLVTSIDDLKQELQLTGYDVGFDGESIDVINYSIDLLGPALVTREKHNGEDIIKPVSILPNIIELSYYSNSLIAHFALEAVIAVALSISNITLDSVTHHELMKNSLELCDLLQYEFIFCKPCQDLEQIITCCIDDLTVRKEIFVVEENSEMVSRSRKLAAQLEDEDVEPAQKLYKLNQDVVAVNNVKYLKNILMPLIESYALTAFTLNTLVERSLFKNELIHNVITEMKDEAQRGTLKFNESISAVSVENALMLYQKWGVLECYLEQKCSLYYLKKCYDNTESVLEVYNKVNKYRSNLY